VPLRHSGGGYEWYAGIFAVPIRSAWLPPTAPRRL
jgi:hypothetical protein